eukprot:1228121-Prymnesium_polylepis.1
MLPWYGCSTWQESSWQAPRRRTQRNMAAASRLLLLIAGAHASVMAPSATATTYRALVAGGVGDSFRAVAKVVELPVPELAEGEVLVRV